MRGVWLAWVVMFAAGCGEIPLLGPTDASIVTVPGSFHAARATPGHRAHFALTGDKQVRCRDCHGAPDGGALTAFERPSVQICATCHEKQQGQHHPFTLDAGARPAVTNCFTCHVFRTDQPVARFEKWACRDCHQNEVHLDRCESCHRPHQQPFTQSAECTECHQVELSHGRAASLTAPSPSVAETCQGCHAPHTPAVQASQQCLSCHGGAKVPVAARVSAQALFMNLDKKGHLGCGTCHPTHAFDKASVKACASCHADKPVLVPDEHAKCTSCHQPHQARAAPKPCESCHQKIASGLEHPATKEPSDGGSGATQTCTGCHPPHGPPEQLETSAIACVSCHREAKFTSDIVHALTTRCDACHVKHAGKPKREPLCASCHADQIALVKLNKGHAKCDDCHAGLPHGEPPEPKACLTCHEKKQPSQPAHATKLSCASCHQSHSAKVIATCRDCHLDPKKPPLPGLHAVAKHRECKDCHSPHAREPSEKSFSLAAQGGPAMCLTCHQRPSQKNHPTPPKQCVGCHLFKPE